MAEFDPQGPADEKNQADQCEDSGSCCGGHARREEDEFVADWSGAEKTLAAQAAAFEATHAAPRTPDAFWVELVQSQSPTPSAASDTGESETTAITARTETAAGVQSEQFWVDLVASQKTGPSEQLWVDLVASQKTGAAEPTETLTGESRPVFSSLSHPPTGMGWSEDEAAEWSPPERELEQRQYEPVQPAGEPVEAEARRDDVEWGKPAEQDWASARSEGFEPAAETPAESQPTLMSAAVEAAQKQARAKKAAAKKPAATKTPAAKKPAAKKPAAKKTTAAKKPAAKKIAAKKPAAKKLVKKIAPAPKITKAPTRRAA